MVATVERKSLVLEPMNLALLKARRDPREGLKRSARTAPFIGDKSPHATPGRIFIAKMTYYTRVEILQLSLARFADLISEDSVRRLLLAGVPYEQLGDYPRFATATVDNIERIKSQSNDALTLTRLSSRLYNPITQTNFDPIELQALSQDRLNGFDSEWNNQIHLFYPTMQELQNKVDRELYYLNA